MRFDKGLTQSRNYLDSLVRLNSDNQVCLYFDKLGKSRYRELKSGKFISEEDYQRISENNRSFNLCVLHG